MGRNCTLSAIHRIAFVLVTDNCYLPTTQIWKKAPLQHIVKEADMDIYTFDLTSAWHHNVLVLVEIVMLDVASVINKQFFGYTHLLDLEYDLENKYKLRTKCLPDLVTFLSKILKEKHHYEQFGLKTTIRAHYRINLLSGPIISFFFKIGTTDSPSIQKRTFKKLKLTGKKICSGGLVFHLLPGVDNCPINESYMGWNEREHLGERDGFLFHL